MATVSVDLSQPLHITAEEAREHLPLFQTRATSRGMQILSGDPDRFFVMSLSGDKGNGYTKFATDYPPAELAWVREQLPKPIQKQLSEALRGTSLELPELKAEERTRFQKQDEASHAGEKLLAQTNGIGQQPAKGDFTPNETVGVPQHHVAITHASDARPVLATYGAGPCIIVAAYNPHTRAGMLCHVSHSDDIDSLLAHMRNIKTEGAPLEVHLAGGKISHKRRVFEVLHKLEESADFSIKSCNLIDDTAPEKALVLDTRTGKIFTQFDESTLTMMPSRLEERNDNHDVLVCYESQLPKLGAVDRLAQQREVGESTSMSRGKLTKPEPRGPWVEEVK